jgi:hypothetical protein
MGIILAVQYAPDTVDAIWLAKVRQARLMPEEERASAGIRLFAGVCSRMKEGLREDHPDADEAEIHVLLLSWLQRLGRLEKPTPIP